LHSVKQGGYSVFYQSPVSGVGADDVGIFKTIPNATSVKLSAINSGNLTQLNTWEMAKFSYSDDGEIVYNNGYAIDITTSDTIYLNNSKYP
jgi:hypothetical protein